MKTTEDRFWEKVRKTRGCWFWTGSRKGSGNSYGDFWNGKDKIMAHRYSFVLHKGSIPEGLWVCHSCDNPSCVNPKHLWLGTALDNNRDRESKGRSQKGKNHWFSKLNPSSVKARADLSKRRTGKSNPFYGKTHTAEYKEKVSKFFTGRKLSFETKQKLSALRKGRIFTKLHRKNLSAALRGKSAWNKGMKLK